MPESRLLNRNPAMQMNMAPNGVSSVPVPGGTVAATVMREGLVPMEKVLSPALNGSRYIPSLPLAKQPKELVRELRTLCNQLGVNLFLQGETPVRSLGFTSAIPGEGKTFMARLMAEVMAENSGLAVTLLECNWENPMLSSVYKVPSDPGLSDWLSGRCPLEAIRRQVARNLTIIPAGNGSYSAPQLLRTFQQRGLQSVLTSPNELLVVDLPSTVTTAYGPLAAQLVDALLLVVCMGVTPEPLVVEACHHLNDSHMRGIIFNQVASRIPRWLQRML